MNEPLVRLLTSSNYNDYQGERSETWSPKIAVASPSFGREVTADSIRSPDDKSSHTIWISCLKTLHKEDDFIDVT